MAWIELAAGRSDSGCILKVPMTGFAGEVREKDDDDMPTFVV